MNIQYLSPLRVEFSVNPNKGRRWHLVEPFRFMVDDKQLDIPAGFWTDFASVPRIIWPIISPYDLGMGPIPHDFGYFTGFESKAYWDHVFEACMIKDKIPGWKRESAFQAVHLFGGKVWGAYRALNREHLVGHFVGTNRYAIPRFPARRALGDVPPERLTVKEVMWSHRLSNLPNQ